jgi:hypothetical protein
MNNILLLPGWMRDLELYDPSKLKVKIGKLDQDSASAEFLIGSSLSTLVISRDINQVREQIILINPPLPKRSVFEWVVVSWFKLVTKEGLFFK